VLVLGAARAGATEPLGGDDVLQAMREALDDLEKFLLS